MDLHVIVYIFGILLNNTLEGRKDNDVGSIKKYVGWHYWINKVAFRNFITLTGSIRELHRYSIIIAVNRL